MLELSWLTLLGITLLAFGLGAATVRPRGWDAHVRQALNVARDDTPCRRRHPSVWS